MDLIDKKHTWNNFSLAFFSPFWNFLVNLLSDFLSDFTCGSRKQSQKALRSWIDNINFMKSNSMNYLFSFFNLAFWTIYESCLWTHCIILWSTGKTSSGFRNFSWSFIDCDYVTCDDFLFLNGFDHFLSQIVYCLHFSCFKGYFPCFRSRGLH